MKINKKIIVPLFAISFLLILIGTYGYINKEEQGKETEKANEQLTTIVQKFNERNITTYFEGKNVGMKAKSSSSTLTLYYDDEKQTTAYTFKLEKNILESNETLDEVTTGNILDTLLNLKEESAYSFFGAMNNHTILDYSLEEDGVEFLKEESGYKIKVDLKKDLAVKEFFDVTITLKDLEQQVLNIEYNGNSYYRKGYIVYKEEIDSNGNKVVIFAQSKYCSIENLRQSIASYLEMAKGKEIKDKFLNEVSNESLEVQSATRDNYVLNNSYAVFKEELIDECFDYYLSNNYRVVTLIIDTK